MGLAAAVGGAAVVGGAVAGGAAVVDGAALVDGGALEVAGAGGLVVEGAGVADEQPANMKLAVIRRATKRTSDLRIISSYINFCLFGSELRQLPRYLGLFCL